VEWYCSEPRLSFNRAVVRRMHLKSHNLASGTINLRLGASPICSNEKTTGRSVNLIGKAPHLRTIPVPGWVKDLMTIGCSQPGSRLGGSLGE
jgi:hypothetical protein